MYNKEYWKKYRLTQKPYIVKVCEICHKEFKQLSNSQKRCSNCMTITCKYCGKKFIPKNHNIKASYCSHKCNGLDKEKVIENLIKNRGTKPRTYTKRNKHGGIEDREWRQKIFERDNYTCRMCKIRGGKLEAHHIKPFKKHPELRFGLENGITLCEDCHKKTDSYGWANYWKNHRKD